MFTGIIEEVGTLTAVKKISGGRRFTIEAHIVTQDMKVSDSVALSGVCLTVVDFSAGVFEVEVVGDTLHKSTLSNLKKGHRVNLERALRLTDRLGGHIVQGHVNGIGRVTGFNGSAEHWDLEIGLTSDLMRYVIPEGSIAVDGVSLTVAQVLNDRIRISVIPHTYKSTAIRNYQPGDPVNIETDFLGKYVEKLVSSQKTVSKISETWLKEMGY